jgi:hypothetical protein
VEQLKGASLRCALALPASIRLVWKGLPGTNTPAYYKNYGRKKLYRVGSTGQGIQNYFSEMWNNVIDGWCHRKNLKLQKILKFFFWMNRK